MKDRDNRDNIERSEENSSSSKIMDRGICEMRSAHRQITDHRRLRRDHRHLPITPPSSSLLSLVVFLFLFSTAPEICHAQCTSSLGCFPPVGNLAIGRTIITDSQCSSGDTFCIPGTTDCSNTCDPSLHSIASINDGNNGTSWISSIGLSDSSNATLQLDFLQPVLFEEMSMLWKSSRPRAMMLERSQDGGLSWEAYRYYSSSCLTDFGLMPMNTFRTEPFPTTDAICTPSQSAISPNTNGMVTFATSEHLPSDTSSTVSEDYKMITNIRVILLDQFVFGSDDRSQYYSVGEWVVRGTCSCSGHASVCAPAPGETLTSDKVYSGCMCDHNTEGTHCESCERGFNAVQWSPGTETDANQCQKCECNGHADDCTSENLEEGILCIDCQHNTDGNHCDMCLTSFYENSSLLFSNPNICIACECDSGGIVDSGACSDSGQCNCKDHVTGLQCTQCLDGYWNFTASNSLGCQECDCDPRGTVMTGGGLPVCDQLTGVCQCLDNVGGDSCNICDDEYFNLEGGCIPCDCNIAGSSGPICDKDSPDGQCLCLPNIDTPTCTTPLSGYYFRYLDHLLYEAEEANLTEEFTLVYPGPESAIQYSGRGLVSFPPSGVALFTVIPPRDYTYEMVLRIQATTVELLTIEIESRSPVTTSLNCATVPEGVTTETVILPISDPNIDHVVLEPTLCLVAGVSYSVRIEGLNVQNSPLMLDSLVLLPDFASRSAYYAEVAATGDTSLLEDCIPRSLALSGPRDECQDIAFALSVEFHGQVFECDCSGSVGADGDTVCNRYGGQCSCREGVTGILCDRCRNGWFNLTSTGCELCACDTVGSISSVCDELTSQCDCQPNVQGLDCDICNLGFFNLTSTGCSDCDCSQFSFSDQCSETGQCPCLNGIGGSTCNQCMPGFYNLSSTGCTACNCTSVGERSSLNDCDVEIGQCQCIGNTVGRDCSQCPGGYYEAQNPLMDVCIECVCSKKTTDCTDGSDEFLAAAWVSDFQQLCQDNPVNCNDDWDLLTASGVSAGPFGPSDATGLGYILLSNNNPMLYAPVQFLGDKQASYGLELSLIISLSTTAGLKDTTSVVMESSGEDPSRLVGVFPPPVTQQEPFSLNTILIYSIPLMEDYWRVGSSSGPPATFSQFKSLMSNITQLSFSAEFREDFIEFVYVQRIQFPTRIPREEADALTDDDLVFLNITFPAELCNCPAEYTGSSCQFCARGHARPSGDILDPCIECNCNNLSLDCDVETAVCTNCTGNSEGDQCERCQDGYYGDPTRGIPCLPCECPSTERSFSSLCFLDSDLYPTCDNCSRGYAGRSCEICADGYFGNPLMGQCITCECNRNVDPALGPVCDMTTGRCLNCLNNTEGFECQFCSPGYYGDPPSGLPCTPCQCHPNGTVGDCSRLFGTCMCANDNVLGQFCDECRDGYWGLSQGLPCVSCDCCSNGSISDICDKDTGQCDCLANVGSEQDDKCCTCSPGYFDFTSTGCRDCGCSSLSMSEECDIVSGQCVCEEGAIGLKCDSCAFGFTGNVPNCTECHPCFHQWYDKIEALSEMVAILQRRASFLVDEYYNGYTVESIEADVQELLDQLASTNASLQTITLDPSSLQQLQDLLQAVNETLEEMDDLTRDTEQQLITAGQMLQTTGAFDGTVNGTTVDELLHQILYYNTTITNLVYSAFHLLTE